MHARRTGAYVPSVRLGQLRGGSMSLFQLRQIYVHYVREWRTCRWGWKQCGVALPWHCFQHMLPQLYEFPLALFQHMLPQLYEFPMALFST